MTEQKWNYNGVEFGAGDRVMIVGIAETEQVDAMGDGQPWQNSWNEDMTECVFKTYQIERIEDHGVVFTDIVGEETTPYAFPLCVLKKVE